MNKHCFPEGHSEQTETNNNPERSPVLDAGGKPECQEKNLRKQVWTGNQMDIQRWDRESNPAQWSTARRKYYYAIPASPNFMF